MRKLIASGASKVNGF